MASKNGHTLYELSPQNEAKVGFDCVGSCTSAWRPLLTKGEPTAKGDAVQCLLGTVKRPNGTTQVTYKGFPVYDFTGDTSAGTTTGNTLMGPPAGLYQTQDTGTTSIRPPVPPRRRASCATPGHLGSLGTVMSCGTAPVGLTGFEPATP